MLHTQSDEISLINDSLGRFRNVLVFTHLTAFSPMNETHRSTNDLAPFPPVYKTYIFVSFLYVWYKPQIQSVYLLEALSCMSIAAAKKVQAFNTDMVDVMCSSHVFCRSSTPSSCASVSISKTPPSCKTI